MKIVNYYFGALMENVTVFGSIFTHILLRAVSFAVNDSVFYVLARGLILIYALTMPVKLLLFRNRPRKMNYKSLWEKLEASSFPSVHAARVVFLSLALGARFDNTLLSAVLSLTAVLVMYSRTYLKKHYLGDVAGGFAAGVVIYFLAAV